jgi:transcriptional regulator with XRE-family HTH domain
MDPTSPPTFGDLLRRYRLAAGLTQEELAERAQVSPRAISDLERGLRSRPWRDTTQLLATALKLDATQRSRLEASARQQRPTSASEAFDDAAQPEPSWRRPTVPALLAALVGRERYRLLESIRQYAWHRLAEAGEIEALRDRHLERRSSPASGPRARR